MPDMSELIKQSIEKWWNKSVYDQKKSNDYRYVERLKHLAYFLDCSLADVIRVTKGSDPIQFVHTVNSIENDGGMYHYYFTYHGWNEKQGIIISYPCSCGHIDSVSIDSPQQLENLLNDFDYSYGRFVCKQCYEKRTHLSWFSKLFFTRK